MIKELLLILLVAEITVSVPVKRDNAKDGLLKKDCVSTFRDNQEKPGISKVTSIESSALSEKTTKDIVKDADRGTGIDCKMVFVVEPNKTTTEKQEQSTTEHVPEAEMQAGLVEEKRLSPVSCPMYQPAVWPTYVNDVVDVFQSAAVNSPWTKPTSGSNVVPLLEDQIVVYPETNDEEEDNEGVWPVVQHPTDVQVLENYQVVHPNGTSEYKLSLSNGLVVYKKIYKKVANEGKEVVVQEGYDSVPIPGKRDEFLTQFYVADEQGYNVYKVEYNHRRPSFPMFLNSRDQIAAKEKSTERKLHGFTEK